MSLFFREENPYLTDPDVLLMLEFQKGNKASFEKLMERHYKHVLNIIYRFVGKREIAEDLTQEVFIRVYKNGSGYRATAKFQTWLYQIAKNISLNELRSRRAKDISLEETAGEFPDEAGLSPSEEALKGETVKVVRSAINGLPESQRLAVILRRYENLSYEDIAKTLNCSIKAVKSLLSRAKENLKEKLSYVLKES